MSAVASAPGLKAFLDVAYRDGAGWAAAALGRAWEDETAERTVVEVTRPVADYEPGSFYKRELPCLLRLLAQLEGERLEAVVVDGYVTLDGGRPGLGAWLWEALDRRLPVIGLAKTRFQGADQARPVWRGRSRVPLWVSAAGLDLDRAAALVPRLGGTGRIPALARLADRAARRAARIDR